MPNLEWSDARALDLPAMNDTHREVAELLAPVENAAVHALQARWRSASCTDTPASAPNAQAA